MVYVWVFAIRFGLHAVEINVHIDDAVGTGIERVSRRAKDRGV